MTSNPPEILTPHQVHSFYASAFAALPIPATLIDAKGIIADLNPAFLEYAAQVRGRAIAREERLGRSFLEFVDSAEEREQVSAFLRGLLEAGQEQRFSRKEIDAEGKATYRQVRGIPLRDEAGRILGALVLREDLTPARRQEQQQQILQQLRDELWRMQHSADLGRVVVASRDGLKAMGLSFDYYSLNLVEPAVEPPAVQAYALEREGNCFKPNPEGVNEDLIRSFWRGQQTIYRPDLATDDPYGEGPILGLESPFQLRSVVDVPFAWGTLAISSRKPHAFAPEEIAFLEAMAQVLAEGIGRARDFEVLERRTRELEAEVKKRRQAEQEVGESEARLQLVLSGAKAGWWEMRLDPEHPTTIPDALYLSPPLKALIGYAEGEFPDSLAAWQSRIPPEERRQLQEEFQAHLEGRTELHEMTYRIRHRDGTWRWLHTRGKILRDSGGQLRCWIGIDWDVTQHWQAEELEHVLERLERQILEMESEKDWERMAMTFAQELHRLVEFHGFSICILDLQRNARTTYFVTPQGMNVQRGAEILPALRQAVETGQPVYRRNLEEIARFQDSLVGWGTEIHSVVDVPFLRGTVAINSPREEAFTPQDIGILGRFAQLVSQAYRRLEDLQALAQTEEQLRQAQKLEAIGQLAGGIAHDFNNLLTIISGYSQLALKECGQSGPREELEQILQGAEQGAALVRQLLAFSRQQVLHPEVLNLNAVVIDLEKMLRRLLGEDIELKLKLDPSPGQVLADKSQLQQILMNLAANARDAMPQGGSLTIETAAVELEENYQGIPVKPGPYVKLVVRDTGIGMDAQTQQRIFEPFFTTKPRGQGTGLGLSTVYGIVRQSQGQIWVHSAPGQGTAFEICLPRCDWEPVQDRTPREQQPLSVQGTETILVVEDDPMVRTLIDRLLKGQGYRVLTAEDGKEALFIARKHQQPIHLLLTDVVMPGLSGRQLAETLVGLHPEVKILYMSGYAQGIIDRYGVVEPGTSLLVKPFDFETLFLKVRQVLDRPE